jgi:hypothetical protein
MPARHQRHKGLPVLHQLSVQHITCEDNKGKLKSVQGIHAGTATAQTLQCGGTRRKNGQHCVEFNLAATACVGEHRTAARMLPASEEPVRKKSGNRYGCAEFNDIKNGLYRAVTTTLDLKRLRALGPARSVNIAS